MYKVAVFNLRRQQQVARGLCFRVCRPSVRPLSFNTYCAWHGIPVLSGEISV